ncbi:hypothetical protein F4703DRAFT_1945875 [Phycomyces blakesleeanus]
MALASSYKEVAKKAVLQARPQDFIFPQSSLTELLYLFKNIKQQLDTKTPLPEIFSIILDLTDYREYLCKEFAKSFVSQWENVGKLPTRVISPDQDPIIGFLKAVALGPEQLKLNEGSSDLAPLSVLVRGGSSHIQELTHVYGNDPGQVLARTASSTSK